MGTRGLTGVVIDGQPKVSYGQFDHHPVGVGVDVLSEARDLVKNLGEARAKARALVLVAEGDSVPAEAVQALRERGIYIDGGEDRSDWYWLLRSTQGSVANKLDAGYTIDSFHFGDDGLFCEYAYVIDLDQDTLTVYKGFEKEVPESGLWRGRKDGEYGAVHLWRTWSLHALPSEQEFLDALQE